jgi:hypothetical protein
MAQQIGSGRRIRTGLRGYEPTCDPFHFPAMVTAARFERATLFLWGIVSTFELRSQFILLVSLIIRPFGPDVSNSSILNAGFWSYRSF